MKLSTPFRKYGDVLAVEPPRWQGAPTRRTRCGTARRRNEASADGSAARTSPYLRNGVLNSWRFFALGLLCLCGCGTGGKNPDDIVLAEVGERRITEAAFLDALERTPLKDRPELTTLEKRRDFLDDLVNKELMELAAFEKYPEPPIQHEWRLKRFRETQIQDLIRKVLVENQITITTEMKDRLFANLSRQRHLLGMNVLNPEEAAYVKSRLDAGDDFGELALDHSAHWSNPEQRGDMGWQTAGKLPYPVEMAVWDAPIGSTIGPLAQPLGTYIFRILEEREAPVAGTRELMDLQLYQILMEPLYMNRQKFMLDSLQAAEEPYFPDAGKALLGFKYYWEPKTGEEYEYLDADRATPSFQAHEESVIVVDFRSAPDWTATEFAKRLEWYATGLWPKGQEEDVQRCLDLVVRDYLFIKAAEDLGLDKDPGLLKRLDNKLREMRVGFFYYNDVIRDVSPTAEQIDAYFQAHRDRYMAKPSYKVAVFTSKKADMMEDLAKDWRGGMSFREVREKYEAIDPDLNSMGESKWVYEGEDVVADDVVSTLTPGAVSAPDMRQDQSSVYQLISTRPTRRMSYEEIKDIVDKDAKTYTQDEVLKAFLAKRREKDRVTVYEDRLSAVEIPASATPMSAGTPSGGADSD